MTSRNSIAIGGGWLVFAAAVLWSSGGIGIKAIDELHPLALAGGRAMVSASFFIILLRGRVKITRNPLLWIGAISICGTTILFVSSTILTTAANAIILQSTAPIWVAFLSWPILREKPHREDIIALIVAICGISLCVYDNLQLSWLDGGFGRGAIGDILALISGLTFAGLIMSLRSSEQSTGADRGSLTLRMLAIGHSIAFVIGLPLLLKEFDAGAVDLRHLGIMAALGLFQLGAPFLLFQYGMRTTTALRASIIVLIEPVLNPIWVFLAIGESPSNKALIGGGLVIAALLYNTWRQSNGAKRAIRAEA